MQFFNRVICRIGAAMIAAGMCARADAQSQPPAASPDDAASALHAICEYYKNLDCFQVTAAQHRKGPRDEDMVTTATLLAKRPNLARLEGRTISGLVIKGYSTDEGVYACLPQMGAYLESPRANNFDDVFRSLEFATPLPLMHLMMLLGEGREKFFFDGDPVFSRTVEVEGGVELQHITIQGRAVEIWAETDESPAIVRLALDKRTEIRYSDFVENPALTAGEFAFRPHKGLHKGLNDPSTPPDGFTNQTETESPYGKLLPDFEAMLANGATVGPRTNYRSKVAVFFFWGSWHPMHRQYLAALDEIGAKYSSRPVAIYAVNLGDSKEAASKYLNGRRLDHITLAYDEEEMLRVPLGAALMLIPGCMVLDRNALTVETPFKRRGPGGELEEFRDTTTRTIDKALEIAPDGLLPLRH